MGKAVVTPVPDENGLIAAALKLSRKLLRKELPERWHHTQGVARRAAELAVTVPEQDRAVLIAAAWLHDIGYAPSIQKTGFHPLDGALYLRELGWDERVTALVCQHSGARFVPAERGFGPVMAEFPFIEDPVSDALTFADQTVGPHGRRMTVTYRIAEAIARHGPDSPNAPARVDRIPYLLAAAERVEQRLTESRRQGAPARPHDAADTSSAPAGATGPNGKASEEPVYAEAGGDADTLPSQPEASPDERAGDAAALANAGKTPG